jgi:IMP dehydrogenase
MTPFDHLVFAREGITERGQRHHLGTQDQPAAIVNDKDELVGMVFRKDYDEHKDNPEELLDAHKR